MTKKSLVRRGAKTVVLVTVVLALVDVGAGYFVFRDSYVWCRNHLLYKIPGRGANGDPYSTQEVEKIGLNCRIEAFDSELESVKLPLSQQIASRRRAQAVAQCPNYAGVLPMHLSGCNMLNSSE